MTNDDDLAQLRRDVRYLMDRTAILDCIANNARGCDRHDVELLTSSYHADGWDVHGNAVRSGPDYADFMNPIHDGAGQAHTHNITTHACEIDGDTAHAESYVLVFLLDHEGATTTTLGGRYLDRLERRDGAWRIAVRRCTVEWVLTGDASLLAAEGFKKQEYSRGSQNTSDLAYQRPLEVDTPSEIW
ncbi:nuclear transport factor 2 family protein [Nocardia sp. CA2R105]|uniref:nuclear transport factor 2 family protein n=1 Tax=Nocardia coffeae TaxID=2873381 RepID=UPI001CA649F0|nr:nuclear transport factor 2 family protein [Nocardia coffeae]MBY8862355.1 nuclear transport factor 2 family protein [Nocardia coffeae]